MLLIDLRSTLCVFHIHLSRESLFLSFFSRRVINIALLFLLSYSSFLSRVCLADSSRPEKFDVVVTCTILSRSDSSFLISACLLVQVPAPFPFLVMLIRRRVFFRRLSRIVQRARFFRDKVRSPESDDTDIQSIAWPRRGVTCVSS